MDLNRGVNLLGGSCVFRGRNWREKNRSAVDHSGQMGI